MRIVVVGLGKVGRALAAQLTAEKHDIVVVDQNPALIENFVNIYDVRGVPGNGASYDVQKEAFENGADLLIATTSSDEINILACMVAKKIGTQHTIARIRNPEYEKQLHFMRDELGLSMVVNPEKATAREMARVLRFPSAIKREQFCRQRFELIEYRITADNPLVGMLLADLYHNIRVKILICAVARGNETIIPSGSFTLEAGDKIYLTASTRDLEEFFRRLHLFRAKASNVMIVGASRMAYYLARELEDIQKKMIVIDSDAARCQAMSEKFPGVLVIHGDGADSELLSEEGLADMDAFVALTGMDETNIILAMYASQFDCKVIAKINRSSFADLAAAKGLVDSVVSTASVTTETIVRHAEQLGFRQHQDAAPAGQWSGRGAGIQRRRRFPLHQCAAEGSDPQGRAAAGGHRARKQQDGHSFRQRCPAARGRRSGRHHRYHAALTARHCKVRRL